MEDTSITKLKTEGYMGCDASLDISLFEYGLAWKETDEEYIFIYGVAMDGSEYNRFQKTEHNKNMDIYEEYSWADFASLLSSFGCTKDEWDKRDLPNKISDLLWQYGYENVFGSRYYEGAEITNEEG